MTPAAPAPAAAALAVIGAGTWGVTLANVLAQNGLPVRCWDVDQVLVERIAAERTHPKLPDFGLDPGVHLESELGRALRDADAVVIAVPSRAFRAACQAVLAAGAGASSTTWVIATKGIEQDTLMLMHEILADVAGESAGAGVCLLSGPSHAEEVSRGLPATVVACAAQPELASRVQRWFFRPYLRVYTHDDMKGVALGGALKNVIAIAAGVADGLGLGDNARAALMTRGLAEIVRLGLAGGARLETFMGLSGVGDLIVTATSRHSRNHRFGELLARGLGVQESLERVGMVVEGHPTARSAWQMASRRGIEMPITEAVHAVLYEELSPRRAVEGLLARDPKPENY